MRVLAIGDIHGCKRALDTLLDAVAPSRDDLLVTLGDYVDWGPDSCGVLDRLIELDAATHLVPLRGNHEELMIRARDFPNELQFWLNVGGRAALASYPSGKIPDAHWEFLERRCVDSFETENHIFAHGGLDPDLPLADQKIHILRWLTFRDPKPHFSGKVLICGHSLQKSGRPCNRGHSICIDTAAVRGGWLTCLDVMTGSFWQGDESGRLSEGSLTNP
jgi:serine/threonine protein phosphatase 1